MAPRGAYAGRDEDGAALLPPRGCPGLGPGRDLLSGRGGPAGQALRIRAEREDEPPLGGPGQEGDGLLGDPGGPETVFVGGIGQPRQSVPGAAAHQILPTYAQQPHQTVVGVGHTPLAVEREEAVREPFDRRDGGHTGSEVEDPAHQVGPRLPGGAGFGYPAPQLDGAVTAALLRHAQTLGEDAAVLECGTGGTAETGTVRGVHLGLQRGRLSVVLVRGEAEGRAHGGIRFQGSGVEVPVEQAHPYR